MDLAVKLSDEDVARWAASGPRHGNDGGRLMAAELQVAREVIKAARAVVDMQQPRSHSERMVKLRANKSLADTLAKYDQLKDVE